jgi:uroporphyrinogen decarboxylase
MTSRERVLTTLAHHEPDRLPSDYRAEPPVTAALASRLGVVGTEGVLDALGVDVRWVEVPYLAGHGNRRLPNGDLENVWGIRRTGAHGGYTNYHPLANATCRDDLEAHPWPNPDLVDTEAWVRRVRAIGDRARFGGPSCRVFFDAIELVGFEKFFAWLYDEPDLIHFLLNKVADYNEAQMHRLFPLVRGELDAVQMVSDFGTQQTLLIHPDMWRAFVRPPFERLFRCAKDYGVHAMLHSDGAIRAIIPDLIEMGLEILNPIQVGATGMDPVGLKRDFGEHLVFHGGIDIQQTLPFGTTADVRDEVMGHFRVLGAGGGWVMSCSHSLLPDVPIENIVTMYQTAREECRYDRQPVAPR